MSALNGNYNGQLQYQVPFRLFISQQLCVSRMLSRSDPCGWAQQMENYLMVAR